ncbi:MAG: hypothetical protein JSU72_15595, partial [Deltaproteobacteria bacterium]
MVELRKSANEGFLLLDAGNHFTSTSKNPCDAPGKVDEVLEAYRIMAYDAINLSQNDLILGTPFLQQKAQSLELPLLSTNLREKKTGKCLFAPYVIEQAGKLKVAVFGLMEDSPANEKTSNAYTVENPFDTARETVKVLNSKADLIICLSSLSPEKNTRLLDEIPDIDFIVSTDKRVHAPFKRKNGYVLSSGNKGRYLGSLDIFLGSLQRPLHLQDLSKTKRLKSNLSRSEKAIAGLEERHETIAASDDPQIKQRFKQEVERLQEWATKYREELVQLASADNSFKNTVLPLVAQKSRKSP